MSRLQRFIVGDAFEFRAPFYWRDLLLGMFWGIAFVWATIDALNWQSFARNLPKELIFVAAPLAIAMLSPRRLLVIFIGLATPLFRLLFLMFTFQSIRWALAVVVWALALVLIGKTINENYEPTSIPDGTTGVELVISICALAVAVYSLWEFRQLLGLNG